MMSVTCRFMPIIFNFTVFMIIYCLHIVKSGLISLIRVKTVWMKTFLSPYLLYRSIEGIYLDQNRIKDKNDEKKFYFLL